MTSLIGGKALDLLAMASPERRILTRIEDTKKAHQGYFANKGFMKAYITKENDERIGYYIKLETTNHGCFDCRTIYFGSC
ncbi:hypothetical protein [Pseudomonas helleri]|uniref:Uncharacterized protein n=1 Tax=Pseudomonas helleri TaxID=1608996 RepID=A0A6L5HXY6_9PSED|nr:hypothetical protein [Pseudomonas helleri]MQU07737.1 hypothetical protein [Pseudomonas helleri]